MSDECPIAYDHTDDLDRCEVCGWTGVEQSRTSPPWADLPKWLWPDHAFGPPSHPVTLCGSPPDDDEEES